MVLTEGWSLVRVFFTHQGCQCHYHRLKYLSTVSDMKVVKKGVSRQSQWRPHFLDAASLCHSLQEVRLQSLIPVSAGFHNNYICSGWLKEPFFCQRICAGCFELEEWFRREVLRTTNVDFENIIAPREIIYIIQAGCHVTSDNFRNGWIKLTCRTLYLVSTWKALPWMFCMISGMTGWLSG